MIHPPAKLECSSTQALTTKSLGAPHWIIIELPSPWWVRTREAQIRGDPTGAPSPSRVRPTSESFPFSTAAGRELMTVCKSSVTRTAGHSCEMGQQRAGVITAETQTRWRLLRWSNPKDGAMQRYLYVHMCAHTSFFFNIYIYTIHALFAALLCGILVRKKELHSSSFPESRSKRPPSWCGKERGGQKKASFPALVCTPRTLSPDELPG